MGRAGKDQLCFIPFSRDPSSVGVHRAVSHQAASKLPSKYCLPQSCGEHGSKSVIKLRIAVIAFGVLNSLMLGLSCYGIRNSYWDSHAMVLETLTRGSVDEDNGYKNVKGK